MLELAFSVAVLGTLADHFTTLKALSVGAREKNPIARWLLGHASPWFLLAFDSILIFGLSAIMLKGGARGFAIGWLIVVGLAQLFAASNNWKVYKELKS